MVCRKMYLENITKVTLFFTQNTNWDLNESIEINTKFVNYDKEKNRSVHVHVVLCMINLYSSTSKINLKVLNTP